MRLEYHNDCWIVCGHIFPARAVVPGQWWMDSGGHRVQVVSCELDSSGGCYWVSYSWSDTTGVSVHEKELFAFQCRYCMILDLHIPEHILSGVLELKRKEAHKHAC